DAEPLHDLARTYLADTRHGLKQRRDLHLANDVIVLALLEDRRQRGGSALEVVLDFGAVLACLGCLLQSGRALVGSEGRKSHSSSPRVSNRKDGSARESSESGSLRQRKPAFNASQIGFYYYP